MTVDRQELPPEALAEREAAVAWLNRHAAANHLASETPYHSSSPARTIDLRARANSCVMHATWIQLGKHLTAEVIEPEAYTDALTRLEAEKAALLDHIERLEAALKKAAEVCDESADGRWKSCHSDPVYRDGYETGLCDAATWLAEDIRSLALNQEQEQG
jgi:hypothetical protein